MMALPACALRAKTAFRRRHWPASFLWSSPANASCAVWRIDNRNANGLYDNPSGGGRHCPWNLARPVSEGFYCFLFGLALLAFGGFTATLAAAEGEQGVGDHLPPYLWGAVLRGKQSPACP